LQVGKFDDGRDRPSVDSSSNRQVPTTNTTPGHEEVVEFDCPDTRRELLKRLYQSQVNELN
jgi:hypothetical protein